MYHYTSVANIGDFHKWVNIMGDMTLIPTGGNVGADAGAAGSLEKSQYVIYVGFHTQQINMSPAHLTVDDLKCMHIYGRSEPRFPEEFVNSFLGLDPSEEVATREPISAQPPRSASRKKTEVVKDDNE